MFQDYEVIKATKDLSSKVLKGTKGTILLTYDTNMLPQYEVEFVNENGDTLDILTVSEEDIEK